MPERPIDEERRSPSSTDATLTALRWLAIFAAVLAIAFSAFGRRLELVRYAPGGSGFDTLVRPIFLGLFVIGVVVALRWEIVGGAIAFFAAAGLVAFATNQLIAPHAVLTVGLFAVPAVLWIVIDLIELPRQQAMLGLLAAVALGTVGYAAGWYAYDRVWGPTHPASSVEPLPESATEWVWTGATTTTTAEVRAKFREDFTAARVLLNSDDPTAEPQVFPGTPILGFRIVSFRLEGLEPDTDYHYTLEVDGELDEVRTGSFHTFPEGPASFSVAFGACARVGSNGAVFTAIEDSEPLLYANIGDFHYGDNDLNDLARYQEVLDLTLDEPAQSALYRSTSIAYVWDDHDYGANNSDRDSFARAAAMSSYRQYVPSYPLAGPFTPVYQAFTIGRVRFVFTDARSGRDPSNLPDDADKSMLGAEQKAWLKDELASGAATNELVVWVNPVPWVAAAADGGDDWGGYTTERRELADFIAEQGITNLVMVSGDAHMAAIDDGTNTNFASDADGPAFPLLHVAALDRPGSVKGGPYSEGAVPGGGHFGTVEVIDDGRQLEVVLTASDWRGETLLNYRFTVG